MINELIGISLGALTATIIQLLRLIKRVNILETKIKRFKQTGKWEDGE